MSAPVRSPLVRESVAAGLVWWTIGLSLALVWCLGWLMRSTSLGWWLVALLTGGAVAIALVAVSVVMACRARFAPRFWGRLMWWTFGVGIGVVVVTGTVALVEFLSYGAEAIVVCGVTIAFPEGGVHC